MKPDYSKSADFLELQPLRIPSGWSVVWNSLHVTKKVENGDFGGSSVFHATNRGTRFNIDVEFRPEFDPMGHFHLTVIHQPLPRNERGERMNDAPLEFDIKAEVVHTFETSVYAELVDRLETWIARCTTWTRRE